MIPIILPLPVSLNQLYNGGSGQQRYPSKKYKAWLASCQSLHPHRYEHAIIEYHFYWPDNKARDCCNYEKCATDYLVKQGVIIGDNWQRLPTVILHSKGIDKMNPRVEIYIDSV